MVHNIELILDLHLCIGVSIVSLITENAIYLLVFGGQSEENKHLYT